MDGLSAPADQRGRVDSSGRQESDGEVNVEVSYTTWIGSANAPLRCAPCPSIGTFSKCSMCFTRLKRFRGMSRSLFCVRLFLLPNMLCTRNTLLKIDFKKKDLTWKISKMWFMRWSQLRLGFDSTAVRLLIRGH